MTVPGIVPTAQGPNGGNANIDAIVDLDTIVEYKTGMGLQSPKNMNPDGSLKVTEAAWAQKQIFNSTIARIQAILNGTGTQKDPGYIGPATPPTVAQLQQITHFTFIIDASWPALVTAINAQIAKLQAMFPSYTFGVAYVP